MGISNYSSSLEGALKRSLGKVPPEFEKAFLLAMNCGGNAELDFTREDGASYNPQAARIAMILLHNASCKDEPTLIASQLIFPLRQEQSLETSPKEAVNIAMVSLELFDNVLMDAKNSLPQNALLVCSSAWLDRLRHFHLAPKEFISENKNAFQNIAANCAKTVQDLAPELSTLLTACAERLRRTTFPA